MGKAANAATLGIHVKKDIITLIDARSGALGLTRSAYAALILEKWVAEGAPAVNTPDRLMQIAAFPDAVPSKRPGHKAG
jgi:hypothetical protein